MCIAGEWNLLSACKVHFLFKIKRFWTWLPYFRLCKRTAASAAPAAVDLHFLFSLFSCTTSSQSFVQYIQFQQQPLLLHSPRIVFFFFFFFQASYAPPVVGGACERPSAEDSQREGEGLRSRRKTSDRWRTAELYVNCFCACLATSAAPPPLLLYLQDRGRKRQGKQKQCTDRRAPFSSSPSPRWGCCWCCCWCCCCWLHKPPIPSRD